MSRLYELRCTGTRNGPWSLNEEQSRPFIQKALDAGINFIDTANIYSDGTSEEIVGRALKDFARRDEIVLATKLFFRMNEGPNGAGLSRKAIMNEIDNSLMRLGTDYVDLYQIHRWDNTTPIEETMEALHDVSGSGLVVAPRGSNRTNYRRDQNSSSGGCNSSPYGEADCGRDRFPRRSVCTASGNWKSQLIRILNVKVAIRRLFL
ncbi:L-fuco-beta-pyranose dehydrogenase [Paenibacillus xylanexedens]|nr:L-fuco-beta-pyranose dehydrogenase [Paenibacillus xylanexedens]